MMRKASFLLGLIASAFVAHAGIIGMSGSTGVPVPGGGGGDSPSWVSSITSGRWLAISGSSPGGGLSATNSMSSVDPNLDPAANSNYPAAGDWASTFGDNSGVIGSWGGGSAVPDEGTYGALAIYNAGHASYYGNEVYLFDLETRTWDRITDPYETPVGNFSDTGIYPDGSPILPHTYDHQMYDPATRSLLTGVLEINNAGGATICKMGFFDLDDLTWRYNTRESGTTCTEGGWAVLVNGVAFGQGGSGGLTSYWRYTLSGANGTSGTYDWDSPIISVDLGQVAAYSPDQDRVVVLDGSGSISFDPDTPTTAASLTLSGSGPSSLYEGGFEWSEKRSGFLFLGQSTDEVYELKFVSGNTWAWTALTDAGNGVTPPDGDSNGIFGRFQVFSYADGEEVAVIVNDNGGAVYAFRVP